MSKLTEEWVVHEINIGGGGILREAAHKVNCLWGCPYSLNPWKKGEMKGRGEGKGSGESGGGRRREEGRGICTQHA